MLVLVVAVVLAVLAFGGDEPRARRVVAPTLTVKPPPAAEEKTAEPEPTPRSVKGSGWIADLPEGWKAGKPKSENGGRRRVTRVTGPDDEIIRLVHTPRDEAQPPEDLITGELGLESDAESARVVLLDGFPTPDCQDRICSDFLLNDPDWGGLAILAAAEPGDPAYDVAEGIAKTVRGS